MKEFKISNKEAISLILIICISHILLSLPRNLLSNIKSSIILNLIFVGFILLIIGFIINKFLKVFPNSDILDISEYLRWKNL